MYQVAATIRRIYRCPDEANVTSIVDSVVEQVTANPTPNALKNLRCVADAAFRRIGNPDYRYNFSLQFADLSEKLGHRQIPILNCYEGMQYPGRRIDQQYFRQYGSKIVKRIISAMAELWPERADRIITYGDLAMRSFDTSYFNEEVINQFSEIGLVDLRSWFFPDFNRSKAGVRVLGTIEKPIIIMKIKLDTKINDTLDKLAKKEWPNWWLNTAKNMEWYFNSIF